MSEVAHFANPRRVKEQACEWLARLDLGLKDGQQDELEAWLGVHPSHSEALVKLARLWDDMDILNELASLFPLPELKAPPRRWHFALPIATACAVVAVAAIGLWGHVLEPSATPNTGAVMVSHYQTAVGEQATEVLPDGSVVLLNTNSSIDVSYSGTERRIALNRGECLFRVAHNRQRPFNVYAGGHVVRAVGTAFDVRLEPDHVDVTVTKGQVKVLYAPVPSTTEQAAKPVRTEPAEAVLGVGETADFKPHQYSASTGRKLDAHAIDLQLSWQNGVLIFEDEPLADVLADVGRYTTVQFVAKADIRNVKVGGYFRAGDIDGLLVALKKNFDIEAHRVAKDKIVLSRS